MGSCLRFRFLFCSIAACVEVSTPTVDVEAGTASVMLANALARKPVVPVVVGNSSACVATTATSSASSRTSI